MYRKNNVPGDAAALPAFLDQELSQIERSQNGAVSLLRLTVSTTAPRVPTDPRTVVYAEADGTSWNPGSGAGLYAYRSGAWVFIG